MLDETKQKSIKKAGIERVNISIPSLDEKSFDESFGVEGYLPIVLKNLKTLHNYFNNVKINYMGSPSKFKKDVINLDDLSKEYNFKISVMELITPNSLKEPLSYKILQFLQDVKEVECIKKVEGIFCSKTEFKFINGGIWELDNFRSVSYRENAFNNLECNTCKLRKSCIEGPYALRLGSNGILRPCLIRNDNILNIKELKGM